jgi:hypothetical protein
MEHGEYTQHDEYDATRRTDHYTGKVTTITGRRLSWNIKKHNNISRFKNSQI